MSEDSSLSWLSAHPEGAVLRVYVQPKASRSEWVGLHGDGADIRLKLRVAAPPVDGEANEEVIRFVRKALKSSGIREVRLLRGDSAKQKDLLLVGGSPDAVRRTLAESGLAL